MSRSIFQIATDFYVLNDLANTVEYNQETGEIINSDDVIQELYNQIELELSDKLDNSVYVIKELLAGAEALKAEKDRLNKRQKALENKAELIKKLALGALQASGQSKLKTLNHNFNITTSKSVVCDEEQLSRDWLRIKFEADKKKIGDALKAGEKIDGARLEEKVSLSIR